jgi:hypothetical protein
MIIPHRLASIFLISLIVLTSGCSAPPSPPATDEVWKGAKVEASDAFETDLQFIIYLHGKIIEDEGVDAVHPEHGHYEYHETLSYLASSGGQVISEVRPAGTNGVEYAENVVGWVERLLNAGVPPQNISIVGFSKGAGITIYVSHQLENPKVNFVLIAICDDWINSKTDIRLSGRILSLFEMSDEAGSSCQELAERSPGISEFDEISYSTGEGHGAFYQAEPFWLDDVMDWISGG